MLDAADKAEIVQRYLAGASSVALGRIYDVHKSRVCQIVEAAGHPRRPRLKLKQGDAAEIAARFKNGEPVAQVICDYPIKESRAYQIVRAAGILPRASNAPRVRQRFVYGKGQAMS